MGNAVVKTKTVKIKEKTGVWYYASRMLLEPYGFPRGNGKYQEKLVKWLKEHNGSKIGDDEYFREEDGGVEITVPAEEWDVAFIILPKLEGSAAVSEGE